MSEGTKTAITIGLLLFVMAGFFWPLGAMVYLEQQERKKRKEPPRFDERQKLVRQRAGNHALYALLCFLVLWAVLDQIGRFRWLGGVLDLVLCALLLAWCVWASECVLHDGFVSWQDKTISNANVVTFCPSMLAFVNAFRSSGITSSLLPTIFAIANALVLLGVLWYKKLADRRADREHGEG